MKSKYAYATKVVEMGSADELRYLQGGWTPFGMSAVVVPGPASVVKGAVQSLLVRFFVALRVMYKIVDGVPGLEDEEIEDGE